LQCPPITQRYVHPHSSCSTSLNHPPLSSQSGTSLDGCWEGDIHERACAWLGNVLVPFAVPPDGNCMWHTVFVLHQYLQLGLGLLPAEEQENLKRPDTMKDAVMRYVFVVVPLCTSFWCSIVKTAPCVVLGGGSVGYTTFLWHILREGAF
jgi:hypothetical protein